MTDLAKPSIDPADEGTLTGTMRHVFNKMMQGVDGMLPARVVAFNGDRNAPRVTVQPLVAVLTTEGKQVSRAQVQSLPVFQFGAGGFVLSFPIRAGDLGWILASDRDISTFLQGYAESRPNTLRRQSFADALFIPDVMRGYSIADADQERAVWQSTDGTVRISMSDNQIKIIAPDVEIEAETVKIEAESIALVSDELTHNGVNIGSDHQHTNSGGTGTGGPPVS